MTDASRGDRSLTAWGGRDGRRDWRLRTGEDVDMQRSRAGSPYAEPDSPWRVKAKIAAASRGYLLPRKAFDEKQALRVIHGTWCAVIKSGKPERKRQDRSGAPPILCHHCNIARESGDELYL
jgi:hypothetical protein